MQAKRIAQNFIKTYGYDRFIKLIHMLTDNTSGSEIAQEFGVTRQRVHQWKHALGTEKKTFILSPEVEAILAESTRSRTTV